MRVAFRLCRLLWVLARNALAQLIGRPRGTDGPTRLRMILEDAGGTWLKFGQVLSLQPDVLPRDYCNALFDLLDRVPPFDTNEAERVFRAELGRRPTEVFDHFDPVPLASASIGQVHEAELDGRRLAVKIQRPDVHRSFEADLRLMLAVKGVITRLRINRLTWIQRIIEEFVDWTREELDYRTEARFMAALGYNARGNPREAVPGLVASLSTRRVLVADFLDGPVLVDYLRAIETGRGTEFEDRRLGPGFDADRLAQNIVRNFVSDAFRHGLFHADLHPANLLILDDGVVGYVDFGITGSLSAYTRSTVISLTLALGRADADAMTRHFIGLATLTDESDVAACRRGFAEYIESWFDLGGDRPRPRKSYTRIMLDTLALSRRTKLVLGPECIRYLRSVITAEGLIARFAPEFDVGEYLEEVCEEELRKQRWRDWFSPATMAEWSAEGIGLVTRAPEIAANLLPDRRSSAGEDDELSTDGDETRALQWGVLTLTCTMVAILGGEPLIGVNLFTTGLAAAAAAATMFLRTIRRTL